jgi:hypothetical protein
VSAIAPSGECYGLIIFEPAATMLLLVSEATTEVSAAGRPRCCRRLGVIGAHQLLVLVTDNDGYETSASLEANTSRARGWLAQSLRTRHLAPIGARVGSRDG